MNATQTEDTFVDEVWNWGREIMAEINQVPAGPLRTNVSLMAGYATGAAVRIQDLERKKKRLTKIEEAAKEFVSLRDSLAAPPDVVDDALEKLREALK